MYTIYICVFVCIYDMCPSATHWTLWAGVTGQERTQRGAFFEDYTLAEA